MTSPTPDPGMVQPGEAEAAAWRWRIAPWPPGMWRHQQLKPMGVESGYEATAEPLYPASALSAAYARGVGDAANEVRLRRKLLHSQFEALDISREDAVYDICEAAIRALSPEGDVPVAHQVKPLEGELHPIFTYTRTFNAIAAATSINAVGIGISVKAFIEAFGPISPSDGWNHDMDAGEQQLAAEIAAELARARKKFPGKNVTFAALVEEVGELATATFEETRDRVRKEAVQVAVMAMRMVLDGDHTYDAWRAEKGLDPLLPAPPTGGQS